MSEYEQIIYRLIDRLRSDYHFGEYCGRSLFSIVEMIRLNSKEPVDLFRLPFIENSVAGFVGYKNNQFVIFTNTSKTLGYEIFTLAHEIYHLIENSSEIKKDIAISAYDKTSDDNDDIADMFASELLMPKDLFKKDYNKLIEEYNLTTPDYKLIIELHQLYYVEYKAVVNRLLELDLINESLEEFLNNAIKNRKEFYNITKKLGYTNELNKSSYIVHLPKRFLKILNDNYNKKVTSFNDLLVIFSYCNLTPEDFGYEEDESLSEGARSLLESLNKQLGSDKNGKE